MKRFALSSIALAAALLLTSACTQNYKNLRDVDIDPALGPNLLDVASSNPDLSTFVDLVKSVGLDDTLKFVGPYTVFAPSNAAFAKMSAAELASLKKPENKAKLVERLKYHIAMGNFAAAELPAKVRFASIMGDNLEAQKTGDVLKIGNDEAMSTVVKPDIHASNGTIHILDSVFEPD